MGQQDNTKLSLTVLCYLVALCHLTTIKLVHYFIYALSLSVCLTNNLSVRNTDSDKITRHNVADESVIP